MNYRILLLCAIFFNFSYSEAQSNKAYAITGQSAANFNWVDIREIDLNSGTAVKTIFESGKSNFSVTGYDQKSNFNAAASIGLALQHQPSEQIKNNAAISTENLVAAAAFDQKHNKLFFMPLRGGELSWLDLNESNNQLKFYTTRSQLSDINFVDEANSITRMTIGADGNGYAITNDGNHLIQFTTGSKIEVKDLGSLIDDDKNKNLSVHNKCRSWGGDIVADAYGKLYLFSASHNVFIIDPKTRLVTYKGSILNLPGTFSTNGAAVDLNDNVIVSSANNFEGFYKVNMEDLKATKLNTSGQIYNASDLANGNLLYQNKLISDLQSASLIQPEVVGNNFISVYPNPISGTACTVSFNKLKAGKYNLSLSDLQGRTFFSRTILLKSGTQVENLGLKTKPASGMYMIKITDSNNKQVFSDKLIIN